MVFNTLTVASAVIPTVIETFLSHYLNHKPLAQKPTVQISYDEGLHLIRQFLLYASHHTVEEIQHFTAQWVPHPSWVKVDEVNIGEEHIKAAADTIQAQLGHHGIERVGGKTWWQWRRPGSQLRAEWIEMRSDYDERKRLGKDATCKRIMLYVHGGGYFFGSVDEHRYQMQRHARKLKARVFAREYISGVTFNHELLTKTARYRLAPQFPFPCGLHDCLAAYMHLLNVQDPTTIIVAGDSAGAGMVLSMLVTIRDRGLPLPAGAILISPWVDLTHSFPSVAGDNPMDYIPPYGFQQRPSLSWPPPNSDDMLAMSEGAVKKLAHKHSIPQSSEQDAVQGFHVNENPDAGTRNANAMTGTASNDGTGPTANTLPGLCHELSIIIDGKLIEIKDQIQMYATNQMIAHPLVSPILQPSLGGLPPLLILTGGGEALRDEQIYLAHKAANPAKYPPGDAFLDQYPQEHHRDQISRWRPTDVQLQVWDDLCHVAPTLSFTRPAKHMYRAIAQFGAWALARAQHTEIEIVDDDTVSMISKSDDESDFDVKEKGKDAAPADRQVNSAKVGKAGDPLPPFKNHMIRQRVDRHGHVYPLEPASRLPGCSLPPSEIGVIKEGPVRKWMTARRQWDTKYASAKRRVQEERAKEMMEGYQTFGDGEVPPPSALAGRRLKGDLAREEKHKRSWGMSLWSLWGSKHDKEAMDREQQASAQPGSTVFTESEGANARPLNDTETENSKAMADQKMASSQRRSRRRTVTDEHQTEQPEGVDEDTTVAELMAIKKAKEGVTPSDEYLSPDFIAKKPAQDKPTLSTSKIPQTLIEPPSPIIEISKTNRPKSNGIAFPFSLSRSGTNHSITTSIASTATLTSALGVPPLNSSPPSRDGEEVDGKDGDWGMEMGKENVEVVDKGKGKEKENVKGGGGEGAPEDRPGLESFVTASEGMPNLGGN